MGWDLLIRSASTWEQRFFVTVTGVLLHFVVIPLDSYTVQCRTCALEHGTSQRMCAACFDEEDAEHKSRHDFFRVWQKLDNAIDPKNQLGTEYQIRLSCKQCPDLDTKKFDSRLKFEHKHPELILRMAPPRSEYLRLQEYRFCAQQKHPLTTARGPACSQCWNFLVWSGKSARSSDTAFKWIAEEPKRAQILFNEMLKVLKLKPDFLNLMRKEGLTGPHGAELRALAAKIRFPAYDLDLINPMVALQKRPYFTRVWVIQETFYAKKIQVYCGNDNVEWDTGLPGPSKLAAVRREKEKSTSDLFKDFDEPLRSMLTASFKLIEFNSMDFGQKISAIFKLAKNTVNKVVTAKEEPPFRHLLVVLLNYWNFSASDPKDKVYALLNLTWMKGIQIDYSEDWSVADVLKNTAYTIIAESGGLNILTVSKCSRPTKNFLPSWALDWSEFDSKALAFQINPRYSQYLMENPFKVNGNTLTLSGYLIDQIVEVGPVLAHHALDLKTQAAKNCVIDTLLAWDALAMRPPLAPADAEAVLCLTLSRGTYLVLMLGRLYGDMVPYGMESIWFGYASEWRMVYSYSVWQRAGGRQTLRAHHVILSSFDDYSWEPKEAPKDPEPNLY
ncbi:hypothetical protein G7Y89_g10905 [Cudoniella acicularis]|uniref:Heterokaryon incompatibility domain-containing protein n=1 Tax=Cudoniella acicularis TaxID=354080 RepID=A0A8H4VYS4_9HELO|nr:hypothetical protein G7Y89_g10905 [Cudoniella acicularis]